MFLRAPGEYEEFWAKVEFDHAAYVAAKPHRDDERLSDVTGYSLPDNTADEAEWLRTGRCGDPGFYFTQESAWLASEREAWAQRQRGGLSANGAVHFLLDGRDGYVELLATGFSWAVWPEGRPLLSDVSGGPVTVGRWAAPA